MTIFGIKDTLSTALESGNIMINRLGGSILLCWSFDRSFHLAIGIWKVQKPSLKYGIDVGKVCTAMYHLRVFRGNGKSVVYDLFLNAFRVPTQTNFVLVAVRRLCQRY